MEYHERKSPRIPKYDYSTPNYYFITICTKEKECLFWTDGKPNALGKIAERCLVRIPKIYPGVEIEKYVVMPNHIHGIIMIKSADKCKPQQDIPHIIG